MSTASAIRIVQASVVMAASLLALVSMPTFAVADTVTIELKSGPNRYEPKSQTVKVGDTVVWVNKGGTHTVTPDDGQSDPFPGSMTLNPGDTHQTVISGSPRTIKYHCEIHGPSMDGEIVVGR